MLPWFFAALFPVVHAAEPTAVDHAWYLAESSRIEDAQSAAAQILQQDPDNVAAHRLYVWLQVKALRDAAGAEAQLRQWLEQDPDNDAARIVLANLLRWRHRQAGEWCTEAESLLVPPPAELVDAYWAQRITYELRRVCPGDQDAPRHAIMKLGEQVPAARAYALRLQLGDQQVTATMAQELTVLYAEQPWRLTYAGNLWKMRGEEVEQARRDALAAADAALASDEPLIVESALRVFRYADEQERLLEAEERLHSLDPGFTPNQFRLEEGAQWVARPEPETPATVGLIRTASRGLRPRQAIALARDFEDDMAAPGPERAAYFAHMAGLYDDANQPIKALEAAREAWIADPVDPYLANEFAYRAATAGLHLEQAQEAASAAIAALPAWDPRGDHSAHSYDSWLRDTGDHAAAFADTHGWVLYRLERLDEAATALRRAVMLSSRPQAALHLHLGLVYDKLGDPQNALLQLGRGMALADGEEPELERQAYKRLTALYQDHRWAPGGLEAWIALQAPAAAVDQPGPQQEAQAQDHVLTARVFADIAFEQDGETRTLSDIGGIRVVDLWATWCGPCVDAMPTMDKLAARYADRGVTFVAISVDADPADVTDFFGDDPPEHVVVGWAGRRAMREAKINGIPSMFVLDASGVVRGHHSGWDMRRGGDKNSRDRIAASIDELLEAQADPEKE